MSNGASLAEVETFRSVLARRTGLRFTDDKLPLLADVLATRLLRTRSRTIERYLERVAPSAEEMAELVRSLTVSETYFFRDVNQFRALRAHLRDRAASGRPLRLLSAGCSSGEEPYSLAMAVRDVVPDHRSGTVSILGVDLNPEVIERARVATYTEWSLRETPRPTRQSYFHEEGGRYRVSDVVRSMVRLEARNLLPAQDGLWIPDAFDVVLCRNVLMYLAPWAARQVVANIARSLTPGGYLFLGYAENLRGLSNDFHLKHAHGTFYYQRRDVANANASPPDPDPWAEGVLAERQWEDTSWFDSIARASSRIERLSRDAEPEERPERDAGATRSPRADLAPAIDLMARERFQDALRLLMATPGAQADPDAILLQAMLRVNTGDVVGAEESCGRLLAGDELNAGAHYVMALCCEHARADARAIEHNEIAAYLDADFAMPHVQRGRMARRAGDFTTARRELELALSLLPRENADRILLFGGGFGREGLVQLCRGELEACRGDS